MDKKEKKLLKKQILKEGGKSAWNEFSKLRRTTVQVPKMQVVTSKKKKFEKYPHAYKKLEIY